MCNHINKRVGYPTPKKSQLEKQAQHVPYAPTPVRCGKESNMTIPEETSPPVTEDEKKYIQRVLGSFLYYAHTIDLTILNGLLAITPEQAKPTKQTLTRVQQLLDYMATNPNAVVRFYASDMILNLHSDASYLSAGQGRSRADG